MELLKELCEIHAPSGEERPMRDFLINYFQSNTEKFKVKPELLYGDEWQDCLIVKIGEPRTAVFAHMDSIGFTVRYENQLVPIGGPELENGFKLKGTDSFGPIECSLKVDKDHNLFYSFGRGIERGTSLTFQNDFRESEDYVQSCYLDNRLGVYATLMAAEKIDDGLLIFSCWEEHGGGTVPFLIKYAYEKHNISQALIADITWITEGVTPGNGVVISLRDRNIPRKSYIEKIIGIADQTDIPFQMEVEGGGSSDGREIQQSPYPIDWCFIGAAEQNVHSPNEKVHKSDIKHMIDLYTVLLKEL